MVERYRPRGLAVSYFLQTNGLLLDEAWAAFLREHHFLIGLSLDGDRDLHDACRPDAAGKGTFSRVLGAARLLDRFGVDYNVLTVVTARTARSIRHIYRFFMKNGLVYQQYIPCLDPLGEARGLHPWSLTPQAYGDFLIRLFDEWYADRRACLLYTSVQISSAVLRLLLNISLRNLVSSPIFAIAIMITNSRPQTFSSSGRPMPNHSVPMFLETRYRSSCSPR